jgi:hypothetical protein
VHAHGFIDTQPGEELEQDGHKNGPATDAEHTGEKTRHRSGRNKREDEADHLAID